MQDRIMKRTVDAVAPRQRDTFLWDREMRGFGVKVTPAGNRIYVLQYRANGRLRRYTIGRHGSPWTPGEARREASRLLGEVAAGRDPADAKAARRMGPTIRDLAQRYLAEHAEAKKKPRSVAEDRRLLEKIILPALSQRKVANLTRADVVRLHHALRRTPYQANRVLALVSKLMNLAEKWGLRPDGSNPTRHVEKFKERKRERFLSSEELARLGDTLATAEANGSEMPSVVTAIRLLILTGARLAEILTLRWEFVDLERACLRLPDSKTGAKVIPLGAAALEVLANTPRIDDNPFVVPGEKPGAHLVGLQKAWERLREQAALKDLRLHDLRHSFASVGASGGDSLIIIGALLGHKDQKTTARYAHLSNNPVRAAADRISGQIDAAMRRRADGEVVALDRGNK